MKKPESDPENYFLEFLLRSYFNKNFDFPKNIINLDPLSKTINSFLKYYEYTDNKHNTTHLLDIEKIFITKEINSLNCNEFGLSCKTYYRHKLNYLQMFKNFLFIEIGQFNID